MRMLVATTAGSGHFAPLVPFARAMRDAGHDVAVAAPGSFAGAVERAGFTHRAFADASREELGRVFASLHGMSNDEANIVVVGEVFGRIDTRAALPGMRAIVDEWRPDLVLRESCEFASYLVADTAGIPYVHAAVGLSSFGDMTFPGLEAPLTELGGGRGLVGLVDAPVLSLLPLSFEDPGATGGDGVHRFRDAGATEPGAAPPLPGWWDNADDPLLYVTFGSVTAGLGMFPDLYRAAVDALADVPVRVLLTLGDAGDPAALGPVPPNVHVEPWWPQDQVMAHASAMVGHGGVGTTLSGLQAGVPMVVVPLFADQPYNAKRVAAIGAGIVVEGAPAALGGLSDAVRHVLTDDSYRAGAGRIAEEIGRLPPASAAVPWLEELAGAGAAPPRGA